MAKKVSRNKSKKKPRKKAAAPRANYKKMDYYYLNHEFEFVNELKDLVIKSSTTSKKKLLKQIRNLGNVKLAIMSGIFLDKSNTSRTDLLIVGENITRKKIVNFLSKIESEIGKSLNYTLMDTEEFKYRLNMYDRFLRDILEFPHEKLINKLYNLV